MIIEGPAEEVRPTSTHGQPTESESTGTPFQDTPTSTVRVVRNKYALFTKQPLISWSASRSYTVVLLGGEQWRWLGNKCTIVGMHCITIYSYPMDMVSYWDSD